MITTLTLVPKRVVRRVLTRNCTRTYTLGLAAFRERFVPVWAKGAHDRVDMHTDLCTQKRANLRACGAIYRNIFPLHVQSSAMYTHCRHPSFLLHASPINAADTTRAACYTRRAEIEIFFSCSLVPSPTFAVTTPRLAALPGPSAALQMSSLSLSSL